MTLLVASNENAPLTFAADPGDNGLYPQAKIRRDDDLTLVDTVNLSLMADGWYGANWVVPAWVGYNYVVSITVYTDPGHAAASVYYARRELELVHVEKTRDAIVADAEAFNGLDIATTAIAVNAFLDASIASRASQESVDDLELTGGGGGVTIMNNIDGKILSREVTLSAGIQFSGGEFVLDGPDASFHTYRFFELNFEAGSEPKGLSIVKTTEAGASVLLWSSPGSTATAVTLTRADFDTLISPGDSLRLVSTGATAAMRAKMYIERLEKNSGAF
jgi:hypothetical protein